MEAEEIALLEERLRQIQVKLEELKRQVEQLAKMAK